MNGARLRRRAHVRLTLIADDLVGDAKFFQQPQHALRAGVIELMNGEHGDFPSRFWRVLRQASVVPAARWKVEMPEITRMLLTAVIYPGNIRRHLGACHESGVRHPLRRLRG